MKKLFFLFLLILSSGLKAQLPHYIHFQAAIRNASGAVLPNQLISLKVELSQGALTYYEIHNITTNDLGLINIDIGGQPASGSIPFSAVDWASGGINLNTWFDPTGSSSNWQWISSSTLASVPYALHALNAFSGDFADLQNVPPLDTSSTNEIQNLSFLNDTLYISSSSGIYLPLSLKAEEIDDLTDGFTSGKSLGLGDGALLGPSYQGINNTAIGYKALESSVGGNNNTALGSEAMKANISGSQNTAIGQTALFSNTTGDHNTAVGTGALYGNTSGQGNLAMGLGALHLNASGNYNIAIGHQAMLNNDAGSDNVAIGRNALQNNVLAPSGIGSVNVSIGLNSLRYAVSNGNVAVGGDGLHHLTTGQFNTALGTHAMRDAKTGSRNVAIGYASMMQTDTAVTYNTAIGSGSGENSSGSYNIYLGHWSGRYNSGNNNILIGNGAGNHTTLQNQSNILVIENSPAADPLIFGDFNANTVEINDNLKVASKVGIGVASPQRTLHISDVMRIEPSASAPTNPSEGDMYMDSTTHKLMVFNGSMWESVPREYQVLGYSADTLFISNGGYVIIPLSLKAEEIDDLTDGFTSGKSLGLGDGALLGPSYQGINNTAIGYKALESSVGGNNNTALGSEAMKANISGSQNTAIGQTALFSNTTGDHNTAVGTGALYGNTSGQGNLAMGLGALHLNASGNYNIAIGHQAMLNNDAGSDNVAIGRNALQNNVLAPSGIGSVNVSIGLNSLRYAVSNGNVAVGGDGLHHLTTGQFNTALGTHAMRDAKTGSRNVAIGYASMMQTDTAVTYNTAIGSGSGENSSGSYNIYLGHWSGRYNSGNNNILIGNGAGNHTTLQNQSNILVIENSPAADPLIFGDFNANTVEINDNLKVASKVGIGVASPQRTLHISDVMRIEPSASAPTNPSEGDMYMDSTTHKLMVFDGTNWQACW